MRFTALKKRFSRFSTVRTSCPGSFLFLALFLSQVFLVSCQTIERPRVQLDETEKVYRRGDYARALTDYQVALRGDVTPEEAELAKFRIGMSFLQMKAYIDARAALEEYLNLYPDGRYAEAAQKALDRIATIWDADQLRRKEAYESLIQQIRVAEQAVAEHPEDPLTHYRLADLYWQAGRYLQSAEEYAITMELEPSFERDTIVVSRVRITDQGVVEPKVPSISSDLFGNEGPLRVVRANTTVQAAYNDWSDRRFVVVSGRVENISVRSHGPANLQITLWDLHDNVMASRVISIPRLSGGEAYDFSTPLAVLGSVYNVSRFECRLYYKY